jgi:hypothetical protein
VSSDPHARFIWADFGWWLHPSGVRKLLSWNAATKELAFWPLTRWDHPTVIAVIADEDEVRRRLDGWADHNDTKEGLGWLAQRLEGCR